MSKIQLLLDVVEDLKRLADDIQAVADTIGKLCQMANGAVFGDDKRVFSIHERKLDALEDLSASNSSFEKSSTNPAVIPRG